MAWGRLGRRIPRAERGKRGRAAAAVADAIGGM